MVAGGKSDKDKPMEKIEIINLRDTLSKCNSLPNLTLTDGEVFGSLSLNEVPLMCSTERCYIFMNGMWIATDKFVEPRVGASLLSFPFKNSR
jgi:hypothetical protein